MKKRFFRNNGFTLLEIAIIIGIMAVLLSGGLSVYRILMVQDYNETTQKRMEEVRAALEKFQIKHNRLPCPAPLHAAPTDPAYGIEATDSCGTGAAQADTTRSGTVRIGALPFATLEISSEHMGDRWGRRLLYAVSEKLADKTIPYDENNGAISFKDSTGNLVPTKTPFVVLSFGKDGRGAVSMAGKDLEPCPAAGPMQENCNNDDIFSGAEYSESESDTNRFTHLALNGFDFDTTTACGSKGMFYGPTHPQRDAEGCVNSLSTPIDDTAALDVKGMIRIGDDPSVCDAASEGVLRYNPATQRNEYCNGTQWKVMGTVPFDQYVTLAKNQGYLHTCAIRTNGTLWCWGSNNYGQLGNGTTTNSQIPVQVSGGGAWKVVSMGESYTCGIKADDKLWCWGSNIVYQFGNGNTTNSTTPVLAGGGATWKAFSAGAYHACGIKSDNTMWCWGYGYHGQIGDGTNTTAHCCDMNAHPNPTQVAGGGSWKMISSGTYANVGIKSDDTLWCWGSSIYGECADGTTGVEGSTHNFKPVPVNISGTWSQATIGGAAPACAIKKTDGSIWCSGYGNLGGLGNGTTTKYQPSQVKVSDHGPWQSLSAAYDHVCAIKNDDTMWCWGGTYLGSFGERGDGTSTPIQTTPLQVSGGGVWKSVSASTYHTCGIKSDNTLFCWGRNNSGQLGDGTSINRLVPTPVKKTP